MSSHLLSVDDFYFPVGVVVEAVIYGFYTVLFVTAIWIWNKRQARRSGGFVGRFYLIMVILMWIIASMHLCISIRRMLRVFILELEVDSDTTANRLADIKRWDTVTHFVLVSLMIWFGDILVLYRTYIVWNRDRRIIALPILIHVMYLIVNGAPVYYLINPLPNVREKGSFWARTVFPLAFAQNVITTGLLAFKIWAQHHNSMKNGVVHTAGTRSLGYVARMIIETALLYTITLLIIIILRAINHPATIPMILTVVPVVGIVFVLLSVCNYFGGSGPSGSADNVTFNLGNFPDIFQNPDAETHTQDSRDLELPPSPKPTVHGDLELNTRSDDALHFDPSSSASEPGHGPIPIITFSPKITRRSLA